MVSIETKSSKTNHKQPVTVRVAAWSARHRWPVLGLWFLFTLGLFFTSQAMGGILTDNVTGSRPGSSSKLESVKGSNIFKENGTTGAEENLILVISHPSLKVTDLAFRETTAKVLNDMRGATYNENGQGQPVFSRIIDPYSVPPQAGYIAPDLTTLRIDAVITGDTNLVKMKLEPFKAVLTSIQTRFNQFTILPVDNTLANQEVSDLINRDLDSSLKITVPLTFAILLIAFGAVVASIVPLVMALSGLLAAFGILGIYSQLFNPASSYASQIIVLIGLAVAVDYSLFMITRFRSERRKGLDKLSAIRVSSSTSGRAVFFSGLTVAISIAGLFILDDPIFRSMAVGTIGVVLISIIGSLTFLPATLSILDKKINWGRIPFFGRERAEGSGLWGAIVAKVMHFPKLFLVGTAGLMLIMTLPVLDLRLGETDITSFPPKLEIVQAVKILNEKWPQGSQLHLEAIVTQADRAETKAAIEKFKGALLQLKGLSAPANTIYSANGKVADLNLVMSGSQNDKANHDLIDRVRQEIVPAYFNNLNGVSVYISGNAAYTLDGTRIYTDAMPLIFAFVLGLSFLLLLIAFHSIVIPVTAILMNLLSAGAAYGALVLVFQQGWFKDQLGVQPTSVIQNWVPVFIFTILFGLSMDYHLFILTRIKEARDGGLSSNEAVARGISIASGTITSAAAIMVMVFSIFMTLQMVIVRQLGLGQAVAVFLDATIVRSMLVPATMRLLGEWNWYMPKFLNWIPKVTIEGETEEAEMTAKGESSIKGEELVHS